MSTELAFIHCDIHDNAKFGMRVELGTPRYVQNSKVLTEFVYKKKYCTTHEVLADDFHRYKGRVCVTGVCVGG